MWFQKANLGAIQNLFLESDVSDTFTQNQFPNSSKIETLELWAGYLLSKNI